MNNDFNFENENNNEILKSENFPPEFSENIDLEQDVDIDFSDFGDEKIGSDENNVNNQNNFSTSQKPPFNAENQQNPPPFQPNYYSYQHSYQQNYSPYQQNPEALQLFYEKNAVKKTAKNIGVGFILFYIFQLLISFALGLFANNKKAVEFINNPAILLEFNIIISFLGFGLAAIFILKGESAKASRLISYGPPKGKSLPYAIMIGIGFCFTANVVVAMVQSVFQSFFPLKQSELELPSGILGFILSVFSVAVAPALIEEFLFRGAIMGSLLKFGKPFAIFTSALLFAMVHGNLIQIPFAIMVGIVIGAMVIETNSFWTGVIIHFLNNFISLSIDYLSMSVGDDIIGIFYMFLLAAAITIGIFGFYMLSIKNKNLFTFKKTGHISSTIKRFGWFISSPTIIVYIVIIFLEILSVQLLV